MMRDWGRKALKVMLAVAIGLGGLMAQTSETSLVAAERLAVAEASESMMRSMQAEQVSVQKYMMVDQFGYLPNGDKVAVLVDPQEGFNSADSYTPGSVFEVRRVSDDAVVFTGAPTVWNEGATEPFSGDRGWWFDFSSVTEEGDYYIYDVQGNSKSHNFRIAADVYQDVLKAAIKTFYYQRIGTPHLAEHAGPAFADGPSFVGPHQDTQARNVFDRSNPATEKDLSGGWMDAGDYNKYVTFTAQPVNELLSAYEREPGAFSDDYNIPESGNGIPDILDEVKWELDWLKKMQESDGGVLMKVGVPSSGGIGEFANPPSAITRYRYYLPKASASTVVTSLNFAHAALVYEKFPTLRSYADDLRERAIQAWDWYHANPKTANADNGEIEAGDADMSLESQEQIATVAAAYLFALTGDAKYNMYFVNNYKQTWAMSDGYWGMYYGEQADAVMFYTTLPNADPTVKRTFWKDAMCRISMKDLMITTICTARMYRAGRTTGEVCKFGRDWAQPPTISFNMTSIQASGTISTSGRKTRCITSTA